MLDFVIMNVMVAAPIFILFFFVPLYAGSFLGANLPLAVLIGAVPPFVFFAIYSAFGSMFPRAGGDYLYESRTFGPKGAGLAFANILGWFIPFGLCAFVVFAGAIFANQGLAPILLLGGIQLNNSAMQSAGSFFASVNGGFVTTIILLIVGAATVIAGTRTYIRIQRYVLVPVTLISVAAIVYVLGSTNPGAFSSTFNLYGRALTGTSNLYENITTGTLASVSGYVPSTFSLYNTFLMSIPVGICITWMIGPNTMLGEVKNANIMKRTFSAYAIAGVLGIVMVLGIGALFANAVGQNFYEAISVLFFASPSSLPFYPTIGLLTGMATTSVALIVLVSLVYLIQMYMVTAADMMVGSRILVAMSLDRSLPAMFSDINPRLRSPTKTLAVFAVLTLVLSIFYNYNSLVYDVIINGSLLLSIVPYGITAVAAVLFIKLRPTLFNNSPAKKLGLAFPILAMVAVIYAAVLAYYFLTVPAMGLVGSTGQWGLVGAFVLVLVYYYANRAYQKTKGINVDAAFLEIPAE